jgi:hypothetical protein
MPRRFPIAQFPNRPMIVAMAAGAVARSTDGDTARAAGLVSSAGILVWAYQEVTDGANWFRRLLGLGGAAYVLVAITRH